ncbi:protein kinase STUNTED isoform X2 [Euphorbia lathyris]|uniref:protein kinase STUNTED isoform X2 n=1 Tax=Euphorbia lathyris TaxID=212925 RepID=UPI003314357F
MVQLPQLDASAGRTVIVGVNLDSHSRQLLTWAMVKVAHPSDTVIALHVLPDNGFCNLKQVDLKLKICRGSSIPKVLLREAKSYSAAIIIVGAATSHRTSVAKYCAKNLPKDCSVLAVNNGKVVFQKEGTEDNRHKGLLNAIQRSISLGKNYKEEFETLKNEEQFLVKAMKQNCSICGTQSADENALALELKPGWPLLGRQTSDSRQMSVVQWAMRLPTRQLSLCLPNMSENESSLDGTQTLPLSPSPVPQELEGLHQKYSATCRLFNYQQLLSATSNFSSENLVGKGGSSLVYKGCLPGGKELAVKILKPSEDVLKEFVLEIEIITTLNHKNIISLLGFGFEDNNLLLVYDFLSRGSLEENLHDNNRKDPLAFGWSERYKVAVGVAEALDYLHRGTAQPVIHRDVKSSNILLSDDFEPQLSDFGLAKWASTSSSHIICSDVAGTFGYLAPEYFMYGKVNEKIDVYAFGVVLLELLSGRKPISNDLPKGQESLVMWAKPILDDGKVCQLLDPSLGEEYDGEQLESMVLAATLCVKRSPRARPEMRLVVKLLEGDSEVRKWAKLQINNVEDDEACNLESHLNLALLDVEDDNDWVSTSTSTSSLEGSSLD